MIQDHQTSYKKINLNLKKAQGMLKKIDIMLQEDQYCGDIAQQINATMGLLKTMNSDLLKSHLVCCGSSKLSSDTPQETEEFVEEFFRLINKY